MTVDVKRLQRELAKSLGHDLQKRAQALDVNSISELEIHITKLLKDIGAQHHVLDIDKHLSLDVVVQGTTVNITLIPKSMYGAQLMRRMGD